MRKDMLPGLPTAATILDTPLEAQDVPAIALDAPGLPVPLPTSPDEAEVFFRPTEHQIKMKARFWQRWQPDFTETDASKVTLAKAVALTGTETMRRWWTQPGFRHWFLNPLVVQESMAVLLHLAMDALKDMLQNTDPKAQSARLGAAKEVRDMAEKMVGSPTALKDKQAEALQAMTREELEKLIVRQTGLKLVNPPEEPQK